MGLKEKGVVGAKPFEMCAFKQSPEMSWRMLGSHACSGSALLPAGAPHGAKPRPAAGCSGLCASVQPDLLGAQPHSTDKRLLWLYHISPCSFCPIIFLYTSAQNMRHHPPSSPGGETTPISDFAHGHQGQVARNSKTKFLQQAAAGRGDFTGFDN